MVTNRCLSYTAVRNVRSINTGIFIRFAIVLLLYPQAVMAAPPAWFSQPSSNNYEIVGYGEAASLTEAKDMAYSDIAQTLKLKVSSSTDITKKVHNGQYDSQFMQRMKTSSSAELIGAKIEQTQQVDDIWYVAAIYDTSSLGLKIKRALKNRTLKNERENYLSTTALVKEINEEVGFKLRYKLLRENELWFIKYKDIKLVISENEFIKFFKFHKGKNIALKLNKDIFYPHDNMKFFIDSKNTGYTSMLYVESNGKVGILYANEKSRKQATYPPKNSDEELTVANPYKKVINEMYLTIWSANPLDLTAFESVQNDYLDDSNYKFGELVALLDESSFSSVVVKIKF